MIFFILCAVHLCAVAAIISEGAIRHWKLSEGWAIPLGVAGAAISFIPVVRTICVFLALLTMIPWYGAIPACLALALINIIGMGFGKHSK